MEVFYKANHYNQTHHTCTPPSHAHSAPRRCAEVHTRWRMRCSSPVKRMEKIMSRRVVVVEEDIWGEWVWVCVIE